jgi:hypothetical protein
MARLSLPGMTWPLLLAPLLQPMSGVSMSLLLYGSSEAANVALGVLGALLALFALLLLFAVTWRVAERCRCTAVVGAGRPAEDDVTALWRVVHAVERPRFVWTAHHRGDTRGETFLKMYGVLFDTYSGAGRRHWFGFMESLVGVLFACLSSVQPATVSGCYAQAVCQLAVQVGALVVVVVWRPYNTLGDMVTSSVCYCGNVLLCSMAVAILIAESADESDDSVTIVATTLTAMSLVDLVLFILQRAADVAAATAKDMSEVPWWNLLGNVVLRRGGSTRRLFSSATRRGGDWFGVPAAADLKMSTDDRGAGLFTEGERSNALRSLVEMAIAARGR